MQRPTLTALLLGSLALSACQTASDTRSASRSDMESGSTPAAADSYASQHIPAPPPAPPSPPAPLSPGAAFMSARAVMPSPEPWGFAPPPVANTERYDERSDNPVQRTSEQPHPRPVLRRECPRERRLFPLRLRRPLLI